MSRRSRSRRSRTQRIVPAAERATPIAPPAPEVARRGGTTTASGQRAQRIVERETPYIAAELRRIVAVAAACFGLLAVLAVIDRLA